MNRLVLFVLPLSAMVGVGCGGSVSESETDGGADTATTTGDGGVVDTATRDTATSIDTAPRTDAPSPADTMPAACNDLANIG
ncbi:MAG: hypothetical protein ABI175_00855, partial [Polyangiales bacterium]